MKNLHRLAAAAASLALSLGAHAAVTPSLLTSTSGSFLTLSSAGLAGVATLSGGAVYTSSVPDVAAMPVMTVGQYLAAGASGPATLTFTGAGVSSISFLWGSPDTYNLLTVNSTGSAPQTFTVMSLGFTTMNGNQGYSQYVSLTGIGGSMITSLTFDNVASANAFEVSNFQVAAPVPEPETYALLLAGLGAIGFVARRRQSR